MVSGISLFGILWMLPLTVKELLLGWLGRFVGKQRKKIWWLAPLCLILFLWKEYNRKRFKKMENIELMLKTLCQLFVVLVTVIPDHNSTTLLILLILLGVNVLLFSCLWHSLSTSHKLRLRLLLLGAFISTFLCFDKKDDWSFCSG